VRRQSRDPLTRDILRLEVRIQQLICEYDDFQSNVMTLYICSRVDFGIPKGLSFLDSGRELQPTLNASKNEI
jgi:hypothetical protein